MYNINKMGKRLNAKIRKQTLELLNQLKQSNKLSNRSYEAFRNNIETSRIDVVKRLKQNFDVIKTTDKTFTKGSLKENVETIKQTKREKIAKLIKALVPFIDLIYSILCLFMGQPRLSYINRQTHIYRHRMLISVIHNFKN